MKRLNALSATWNIKGDNTAPRAREAEIVRQPPKRLLRTHHPMILSMAWILFWTVCRTEELTQT